MKNVLVNGGLRVHTIPKVASTSLSAAMVWKQPRRAFPDEANDDFKVMAVRHPFERLVSAWRYFTPGDRLRHSRVLRHDVWPDMPFGEFLRVVCSHPTRDKHTAPQTRFKGGAEIDMLVRLENLQAHWKGLLGRFPIVDLDHRNKSQHDDWETYATPELWDLAMEHYAGDLELYEHAA